MNNEKNVNSLQFPSWKFRASDFGCINNFVSDSELTNYENVLPGTGTENYFGLWVLPHLPDAYIEETFRDDKDKGIGRVSHEINFNRFFYKEVPPRRLEEIDADLTRVETEIAELLRQVMK
jgi:type I restriction enzyme M protein